MITPIGLSQRVFSRLQSKLNTCNSNKVQSPIKLNSKHTTFTPPSYDKAVIAARQILKGKILEHLEALCDRFPKDEDSNKHFTVSRALLNGWVSSGMVDFLSKSSQSQENIGPLNGCLVLNIGEHLACAEILEKLGASIYCQGSKICHFKNHLIIGFGIEREGKLVEARDKVAIQFLINHLKKPRLKMDKNGLLYITIAPYQAGNGESYLENSSSPCYERFKKAGWEIRLHHAKSGLIIASPIVALKVSPTGTTRWKGKKGSPISPLDAG